MYIVGEELEVAGDYDVIVAGGGIAGLGAALASARSGLTTLIIEKNVVLGGLATLGLIAYYLPICDGRGRKIIGGIAEELLHLSIKYGYSTLNPQWTMGIEKVDGPNPDTRRSFHRRRSSSPSTN
jgi:flavin-dependent dehydrogenase